MSPCNSQEGFLLPPFFHQACQAMVRWLCGVRRDCELSCLFAEHGIEGEKKKAVLDAMHKASHDDLVLVIFWDQHALDRTGIADAKQTLLNALTGAVPRVTRSLAFPDEVINLEDLNDYYAMRYRIMQFPWARGDAPGAFPIAHRPVVARTLLITDMKKKVPTFTDVGLFT